MPEPLLEVQQLGKRFGGVAALEDVSLQVSQGETVGLIGPNGAGKTTFFNCVTGVLRPTGGIIQFGQQTKSPLVGLAPHEIVQYGISRTFQNIRLFPSMTTLENVMVGTYLRTHANLWSSTLLTAEAQREEAWARERALELLQFVGLGDRQAEMASSLPFGLQRRLELARALATDPALLLLDEPAAGLNAVEKQALLQVIAELKHQGLTIILIEHDMRVVMPISDRVAVLDEGRKIADGPPEAIQQDPKVIEAYLGASETG